MRHSTCADLELAEVGCRFYGYLQGEMDEKQC